ncbi:MAG: 2-hydroxyacyl-CoA dehydratase [Chloroflexi bacterium]|nr:2-hydroxyacyl-CoA dehydratase [Chloroflexota bacterium]
MKEIKRWQTKPLDSWQKAKEMTKSYYASFAQGQGEGKLVTLGGSGLEAGIGEGLYLTEEPYAAQCAAMGISEELGATAESLGYARDLCSYMRLTIGSMKLNKYAYGGAFPKIDLVSRYCHCDLHAKWSLIHAEELKVPFYAIDGVTVNEFDSEQTKQNKYEYRVAQTLDAIEGIEKTTGKKFDDEAFIEGLYNTSTTKNLWGQIVLMNQNIPVPLDEKSMYSFFALAGFRSGEKEVVNLIKMLRDEVEDRVRNQIAAVATERYRIMTFSNPPWYALGLFRYMEKFGVVSVGSRYAFLIGGGTMPVKSQTGGIIELPYPTIQEEGKVLRTREEAVRYFCHDYPTRLLGELADGWRRWTGRSGMESQVRLAKLWHCNGAVLHFNRGCMGFAIGCHQVRLALKDAGYPVVTYEASNADAREWDESRTHALIDTFMESQGLEKLED